MKNVTNANLTYYDFQYHHTVTKYILKSKSGYIWVHTQLHSEPVVIDLNKNELNELSKKKKKKKKIKKYK